VCIITPPPILSTHLRLSQHPKLTIRHITRHIQSPTLIERQSCRSKAARARRRPITRTLRNVRIGKDILSSAVAGERLDGDDGAVGVLLEVDGDELEACGGGAVPRSVERDEHLGVVGVELAVDRGRVWEQRQRGLGGFLLACVVVHRRAGRLHEPVADLELLVREVAGLPHGETRRVPVPVVVGLGHVAHEVDLLAWVVVVHILAVAGELVTAVLYTPQPAVCQYTGNHLVPMGNSTGYSHPSTFRPRYAVRNRRCSRQRRTCTLRLRVY
jgi:hypothetical protein